MNEFKEFVSMGGYAAYVWSAYFITFVVLIANVWMTRMQLRRAKQQIARKARQRNKQNDS